MARGDHLVISYGAYTHHAIDIGDGTVVQFSKEAGVICLVPYHAFCDGRKPWVREYHLYWPEDEVVQRALDRVGQGGYCLWSNNCEHFCTWCKTGEHQSAQVRAVQRQLVTAGSKGIAKASAKALAKGSTKVGAKALARVATPWLLVADAAQLGSEVVAANLGADPEDAEMVGRGIGLLGSVGIGAAVGGPVGAGLGLGIWALGEVVGSLFTRPLA